MMFSIKSNILQTKNTDILTLPFIMKLIHRVTGMNKIILVRCKHIGSKGFCKNISKVIFSGHIIQLNQAILQCFSCVMIKNFNLLSSLVHTGYLCNSHCRFRIRLEQERSFVQDACQVAGFGGRRLLRQEKKSANFIPWQELGT